MHRPGEAPDLQELAATLRAQAGDLSLYAGMLMTALSALPPELLQVERGRRGLLRRADGPVTAVTVVLDAWSFRLERAGTGAAPLASVAHVVRGVQLSRESVPLVPWSERLAQHLLQAAGRDAGAATALEQLVRPTP